MSGDPKKLANTVPVTATQLAERSLRERLDFKPEDLKDGTAAKAVLYILYLSPTLASDEHKELEKDPKKYSASLKAQGIRSPPDRIIANLADTWFRREPDLNMRPVARVDDKSHMPKNQLIVHILEAFKELLNKEPSSPLRTGAEHILAKMTSKKEAEIDRDHPRAKLY